MTRMMGLRPTSDISDENEVEDGDGEVRKWMEGAAL